MTKLARPVAMTAACLAVLSVGMAGVAGAATDKTAKPTSIPLKAAKSAVCKINIDSDGRLAMTATIRKIFVEHPAEFDPRKYLGPARDELKKLYMHKCEAVLGSAGKA